MLRMVATDLDGTIVRSDLTVSPRTRAVLAELERRGVAVVPATARQRRGIAALDHPDGVRFSGWAASSNGAVVVDLPSGDVLAESTIPPADQVVLAERVLAAVPGSLFFGVRAAGTIPAAEAGYQRISVFDDHKRDPAEWEVLEHDALLALPNNKIAIRHPDLSGDALADRLATLDLGAVQLAHSGAPFVDVTAAGVSKAWGLQRIVDHLGISTDEVIAFGDERNDVAMLAWAGHGVAVAHAGDEVRAVADEVCADHDEDGPAQVLERLLTEGSFAAVASGSPHAAERDHGG